METKNYDYTTVEQKWQKKWYESKIYEAKKQNKKKFFIHFAYPGVSGYLHVGHMRGFTYCDIIARYKKMTGYDVLFPAGFHASGIPSVGFAKKVERKDPSTIKSLKENGLKYDFIKKLVDPVNVVEYFGKVYVDDYWKKFGFLIDYSRLMSTISPGYKRFIQWQFHKLKEKNLLIQKPHYAPFCQNCGPVAVDKSETDISKGGSAEILEFTTIKFQMKDGTILPAATLRPETIFGVTNMWVNPNVEYQKAKVNDETWICSKECIQKLEHQLEKVELLNEKIPSKNLVGKTCKIPLVNREVPILAGVFADPNVATGIVMSVPAHAPYDWIALLESGEKIEPITIIDVEGFGTNPAKQVCDELGIKSQTETEKLNNATEIVYKKEFHTGYLNENCGVYAGVRISDIKDEVKNELISQNLAVVMREFSEEVVCRCGGKVFIKQIPDQWFIKYSDTELTDKSKKHEQNMNIYPQEYKEEMPKVLDWFGDRACIRRGSWLGTEFPFKKGWIIEPISDSTLYPAYYIISKYVNENKIKTEDMTNEFFDYVFLGRGEKQKQIWDTIKSDFDYWYPVDINLGGKEHKTVHFPVFLMNHVAIMPENKWPKGIFVHWWVTQKGKEKISKSKGGAEHINEAATTYGVDAMRLYYAHVGSPFVDIEWDQEVVTKYKNRVINIYKLVNQINELRDKTDENLDNWMKSILQRTIKKTIDAFEAYDLRIAANEIFFEFQKNIQWYLKRGGSNKKLLKEVLSDWLKLMTPVTPHLTEELWTLFGKGFVSLEKYPEYKPENVSEKDEVGEKLLSDIVDDVNQIIKVTGMKPKKLYMYVSPMWKKQLFEKALALQKENKLEMGSFMKTAMSDPEVRKHGKEASDFINKMIGDIKKLNENDRKRFEVRIDEKTYLEKAADFFKKEFNAEIKIFDADDKNVYDPAKKTRFAVPLRPAIYLE
ncbi:MAG: leucine--tRNA ligase [Candidatus Thermoplasmatota archaeon]|jgi:leucyl-tRNA synthetase|nr:leucine--tRNA ligase [Candidatus Thermoplasmatota archaeon]